MANHVRRQLREAIAQALTGLPTTGARVFQSRVTNLQEGEFPALKVMTTGEETVLDSIGAAGPLQRQVAIEIVGAARGNADLDDTLDQIAAEVEAALSTGIAVTGHLIPLVYQGCSIEFDAEGAQPVGSVVMRYQATFYTAANAPTAFL